MKPITSFQDLTSYLKGQGCRKRVAVVCPYDKNTRDACLRALEDGFADLLLVGDPDTISEDARFKEFSDRVTVIAADSCDDAAAKAVALVKSGEANVLMKGLINTDNYLRAILNKQTGILMPGSVLTHITAAQMPEHGRLLFFSDAAVIPFPTLEQRKAMVGYMAGVCRKFGIAVPRIALVHCSEKISEMFPVTIDYIKIKEMAASGMFGDAVVDGPMDVKTAFESEAADIKGIDSPIGGLADALIFPDIEAGNAFYKTITHFCHAENAGMILGTPVPVVLPSRSDDADSKYYSMAAACLISG